MTMKANPNQTTYAKTEQGWECPRCRAINAPWREQCNCFIGEMGNVVTTGTPPDHPHGYCVLTPSGNWKAEGNEEQS